MSSLYNPHVVFGALGLATSSYSDFIAGPEPDSPAGKALHQASRRACDNYANGAWPVDKFLDGLNPFGMGAKCQQYWNNGGYDGPVAGTPPFTGGQCQGVEYGVIWNWDDNGSPVFSASQTSFNPCSFSSNSFPGPIGPLKTRKDANGGTTIFFTHGAGEKIVGQRSPDIEVTNPRMVQVKRCDGQADNCGNPPTPPLKPGPNPPPNTDPYKPGDEPAPDPTDPFNPRIPFPPIVDPVLGPRPFPSQPGPSTPPPVGEEPAAGNPIVDSNGGGAEDYDFGDPGEGFYWCGAHLKLVSKDFAFSGHIPAAEPNSVFPRIVGGWALKYRAGGQQRYMTIEPIRGQEQSMFLPLDSLEASGATVYCVKDYNYILTPLKAKKPEQPPQEV